VLLEERKPSLLVLIQQSYINEVLYFFNMFDVKSSTTPIAPHIKLSST
jgi:hypothetical protein